MNPTDASRPFRRRDPWPAGEGDRSVALVHDWLTGMRGGEKCLEVLCDLFPGAHIFTLVYKMGSVSPAIAAHTVTTSFLQRIPLAATHYRYLLPLFPLAVEGLDLEGYRLVISTSHCAAKGVVPPPEACHVCYCLTPMRYVWDLFSAYFRRGPYRKIPAPVARIVTHYLRSWDVSSSTRVDHFLAVSKFVASRIRRYYARDASVLYPPVDCSRFAVSASSPKNYYLLVSAAAPYKRVDLALEAFAKLDRPLRVVGTISREDLARLRSFRRASISYAGWVSGDELAGLYADCKALVFPGEEDFGMAMVEAQASGRPVIAFGKGGALEAVRGIQVTRLGAIRPGRRRVPYTGVFFSEQTADSLARAVEAFESIEAHFDPEVIRSWAQRFDRPVFERGFLRCLQKVLAGRRSTSNAGDPLSARHVAPPR